MVSLFRYGLDYIVKAILKVFILPQKLQIIWQQLILDYLRYRGYNMNFCRVRRLQRAKYSEY